jgi:hypothetical protein
MYYLQSEYKTLSPKTRDRRGRDRETGVLREKHRTAVSH